jgi:hypothetical protein
MRLPRQSIALALVASLGVYVTPLVGPHTIELLGPGLFGELTAPSHEPAWIAANFAVALAAQAILGLAALWAFAEPRRRWPMVPLTFFAIVFTLPSIYLVVIPVRFLIEPDVAPERQAWTERCVVRDTSLMTIRTPVTVTAPHAWWAQRSTAAYALVRGAECDAIDVRLPRPAARPGGGVDFMLSPSFATPRGGTMFERFETASGARSWWRLSPDGARLDPLPVDGQALQAVLSNDGGAVGWLEPVREADAPAAYRLRVRTASGTVNDDERVVPVPFAAIMLAPVELDTRTRLATLWSDDRTVTVGFDGAVVHQSPRLAGIVRAQPETYERSGDGWLAWDAYREEGRYRIAWSLASGSRHFDERKGRSITSAALDPSGRYVAVSATTTLSIGNVRDTVYVLRTDTGEEVFRRYLPTYTRTAVAFLEGGLFAYSDAAGTHILTVR